MTLLEEIKTPTLVDSRKKQGEGHHTHHREKENAHEKLTWPHLGTSRLGDSERMILFLSPLSKNLCAVNPSILKQAKHLVSPRCSAWMIHRRSLWICRVTEALCAGGVWGFQWHGWGEGSQRVGLCYMQMCSLKSHCIATCILYPTAPVGICAVLKNVTQSPCPSQT